MTQQPPTILWCDECLITLFFGTPRSNNNNKGTHGRFLGSQLVQPFPVDKFQSPEESEVVLKTDCKTLQQHIRSMSGKSCLHTGVTRRGGGGRASTRHRGPTVWRGPRGAESDPVLCLPTCCMGAFLLLVLAIPREYLPYAHVPTFNLTL